MKKKYIQPSIKSVEIKMTKMVCGSQDISSASVMVVLTMRVIRIPLRAVIETFGKKISNNQRRELHCGATLFGWQMDR